MHIDVGGENGVRVGREAGGTTNTARYGYRFLACCVLVHIHAYVGRDVEDAVIAAVDVAHDTAYTVYAVSVIRFLVVRNLGVAYDDVAYLGVLGKVGGYDAKLYGTGAHGAIILRLLHAGFLDYQVGDAGEASFVGCCSSKTREETP